MEIQAPQHPSGIFHRQSGCRRALIQLRQRQGCTLHALLGLLGFEKLRALKGMVQEHPWMLDWQANPGAVFVSHQGHNGTEDTPPASLSMICDALPLLPPATPHAGLDLMTPERLIEHPSPPPEHLPATINESPTQPPAPVTHPARRSQNRSSPLAPNNTLSTPPVRRSARRSTGSK